MAPCIMAALSYINDFAPHADGLFRRPGVLSRVRKLQQIMNDDPSGAGIVYCVRNKSELLDLIIQKKCKIRTNLNKISYV